MAKIEQVATLKAQTEGVEQATKEFETLASGVNKAANSAENLDAKFEDVFEGVQPLTTRLGEAEDRLYELALAGDTTSKEYQDLLNKVAEYRKTQIETDRVVDQAAQTFSQKLGTAIGGVTSGFAVVQGAMALVGSESEALEKSLLKVQAALAIQQGVAGVLEYSRSVGLATKATKLWNAVLKANPIGLIITAVVSLVAAVGTLSQAFSDSANQRKSDHEQQLEQIESTKIEIQQRVTQLKLEDRYRESRIKGLELDREVATSKEEIAEIDKKIFQERIDGFETEREQIRQTQRLAIESAKKRLADLKKQQEEGARGGLFFSESEEKQAQFAQYVVDQRKYVSQLITQLENDDFQAFVEIKNKEREFIQNFNAQQVEEEKQTNEKKLQNYRDYQAARLSALRYIEDLQFAIMEEGVEKEVAISNAKFNRLIEDALANEKFTADEKNKIRDLLLVQQFEAEDEIRKTFRNQELQEEIDFFTENKLPVLKAIADEEVKVEISKYSMLGQVQKKAFDDEKERRKQLQDFAINSALSGLQTISDITELFGKKGEKQARRAFQVQKAVNIAQALITTYQGANAIFASAAANPKTILFPAQPFIAAGLAIASGLANVAKISAQKFEGGSASGGSSTGAPNLTGGESVAPSFNVVGDSGVNQLAQLQQQPVQAFVVSGEVTTSQALDRNRVENATL